MDIVNKQLSKKGLGEAIQKNVEMRMHYINKAQSTKGLTRKIADIMASIYNEMTLYAYEYKRKMADVKDEEKIILQIIGPNHFFEKIYEINGIEKIPLKIALRKVKKEIMKNEKDMLECWRHLNGSEDEYIFSYLLAISLSYKQVCNVLEFNSKVYK